MICSLENKTIEDFKPTSVLPQTSFWGRLKDKQGFDPRGFELTISRDLLETGSNELEKTQEDLLVLIRYLDQNHCFAYVPYGPKLEPAFENQGVFLETLSESIRPYLPSNCMFIRYDLMWQNQWAAEDDFFDAEGNWTGPPQSHVQEFRVNYKTAKWRLKKSPGDILPKNTFFLDLSLNEKKLLSNMRYNTRYNIRRALKNGIRVDEYGIEHVSDWYDLYLDTALRHTLPLKDEAFFTAILKNQDNRSKGVRVKLLMARYNDDFMAAMFLVLSGKRATYLYGASSPDKNNRMASYALQWESIRMAKNRGCSEYDMFGSAPNLRRDHPLHGIHVYKRGFGGHLYHRMGCWDYPFRNELYEGFRLRESAIAGQ